MIAVSVEPLAWSLALSVLAEAGARSFRWCWTTSQRVSFLMTAGPTASQGRRHLAATGSGDRGARSDVLIDAVIAAGLMSRGLAVRMAEEPIGRQELARLLGESGGATAGKKGMGNK